MSAFSDMLDQDAVEDMARREQRRRDFPWRLIWDWGETGAASFPTRIASPETDLKDCVAWCYIASEVISVSDGTTCIALYAKDRTRE